MGLCIMIRYLPTFLASFANPRPSPYRISTLYARGGYVLEEEGGGKGMRCWMIEWRKGAKLFVVLGVMAGDFR